jgi:DNA primase
MFPIRDESSRIIAFGGRVMPGSEDPAKYLNSPETPLFTKSKCLYGLDLARQKIVETLTVAVVEGYTDVVMAHQFGASNVVSPLGTALTGEHVNILRRFADRIVLLFDADTAGDMAVNRAVELFLTQPIEIAIASMPEGIDPDEYLLEHGADGFAKMLSNASDALSYKWKQLAADFLKTGDLTSQQKAVQSYLDVIGQARGSGPIDPIRWGAILTRVSRLTEIPVEELHKRFRNVGKKPRFSATPQAAEEQTAEPSVPEQKRSDAHDRAEQWILGVLLLEPHRWQDVQHHLSVEEFTNGPHRRIAELYWNCQRDDGEPTLAEFVSLLDEGLKDLAMRLVDEVEALSAADGADADRTLSEAMRHLDEQRKRREEAKLIAELRRTSGASDAKPQAAEEIDLLRKLQEQARRPDMRRVGS